MDLMSNGLFIRAYPVRGASIIPSSYTVGPNGYFLLCLFPVIAIAFFVAILHNVSNYRWAYLGLFASTVSLMIVLAFLRRLRLDIRLDGLTYIGLFGEARFVAFSEMSTVVFIDHRHLSSEAQPRRNVLSWTAIITPNIETGKRIVKIPLTLFPEAAFRELTRILHPEIWESGT